MAGRKQLTVRKLIKDLMKCDNLDAVVYINDHNANENAVRAVKVFGRDQRHFVIIRGE